jgi:hypothetical protein
MSPFDSPLQNSYMPRCCSFLKVLNQNLNLEFYQMIFLFKFLDIHMNERAITCLDCHGFQWQKYKYLSNFNCFSLRCDALFGLLDCD